MSKQLDNCILCQIFQEKLPSYLIQKNQHCSVILDKWPISRGHMLVVSHQHCTYMHELTKDAYFEMWNTARHLSQQLTSVWPGISDCNILVNNGQQAGQHIAHVHIHIIPRKSRFMLPLAWRIATRFINPLSPLSSSEELAKNQALIQKHLQKTPLTTKQL